MRRASHKTLGSTQKGNAGEHSPRAVLTTYHSTLKLKCTNGVESCAECSSINLEHAPCVVYVLCVVFFVLEKRSEGVVATSLDSRKRVLKKYPRAETWLPQLHADGAQVRWFHPCLAMNNGFYSRTSVCDLVILPCRHSSQACVLQGFPEFYLARLFSTVVGGQW